MKNDKVSIGIIVILLIIIAIVASQNNSEGVADDDLSEETSEETALVNENGVVASANDNAIIGVWQSVEDKSYVLEFASEQIVREYYARELIGTGTWSVNEGILTKQVNGSSQSYNVSALSSDGLTIEYHGSSEILEFSRVSL